MHIPQRYRDRYDRLAASHPWMREMRDEDGMPDDELIRELRQYADDLRYEYNSFYDAFEPDERLSELCGEVADMLEARDETNGINGETNGITDEITLPEGDAVKLMRECCIKDILDALGIDCRDRHHTRKMVQALADMVERDYVSRQDFAAQHRTLCAVREQRDELKTMNEKMQVALDAVEGCDERCKKLEAERDEWKAKAEAKSAKRAAAVERLKANPTDDTFEKIIAAAIGCTPLFTTTRQTRDMLIDLLADDDDCGHSADMSEMSADCVRNDGEMSENDVSATDVDANDGNADSREKLEADVRYRSIRPTTKIDCHYDDVLRWLDRQAAITERELESNFLDRADEIITRRELEKRELQKQVDSLTVRAVGAEQEADELEAIVDRLTKERDNLAADLKSCEGQLKTERNNFRQATGARDYWRDKLSMVLDRLRELGCEVGSINDVPITVELPESGR